MKQNQIFAPFVAVGMLGWGTSSSAAELISNGGFESAFSGWTRFDQLGSADTFYVQTGTVSPINGFVVPAPPGGTFAVMTDAQGTGSHALYQDFVIPASVLSASLSFSLYLNNHATVYTVPNPASLDFSTPSLNQQARVDILTSTSDPFSVAAVDVLLNVYQTQVADPLVSGYTVINQDLTALLQAHLGETLRLRFAEVDNVNIFNAGIDNVSLNVQAVPEVSALVPSTMALAGMLWVRRRFRR